MKRSEINQEIRLAEKFFREKHFQLPPFAGWSLSRWRESLGDGQEILSCFLGWDITDFGRGAFRRQGLLLFTLRNGLAGSLFWPKTYAEKIMIVRESQLTLMHCHRNKTEDIINRAGGKLRFQLFASSPEGKLDENASVEFAQDGIRHRLPGGESVTLTPGESITLTPGIFHSFIAEERSGDVLVGEVSSVNDDDHDNVFHEPQLRFPEIAEDEPPYRLLVKDYKRFLNEGK